MRSNIFFQAVPAVTLGGETSANVQDFQPLDHTESLKFIDIISALSKVRGPFANFLHVPSGFLKEVVASPTPNPWHCKSPSSHWIAVDAQGRVRICGDKPLSREYFLTGKDNPLFTPELHRDIDQESAGCRCSWLCYWEGNRGQLSRGLSQLKFAITINSLT